MPKSQAFTVKWTAHLLRVECEILLKDRSIYSSQQLSSRMGLMCQTPIQYSSTMRTNLGSVIFTRCAVVSEEATKRPFVIFWLHLCPPWPMRHENECEHLPSTQLWVLAFKSLCVIWKFAEQVICLVENKVGLSMISVLTPIRKS